MKSKLFCGWILFSALILFPGCDPDEPMVDNEEELITTVRYILTPIMADGVDVATFSFVDEDGDGGNDPIITVSNLKANVSYSGSIELLNESVAPSVNITEEIEAEKEDHQFFYKSSLSDVTIEYEDEDANGNPVGLMTELNAGIPATGTLTIVLRHEPVKDAPGVQSGDITNAEGSTDIEINFPLTIE